MNVTAIAITGAAGLVALVLQVVNFLRRLTTWKGQSNALISQGCAFAGGIVGVFLFGASDLSGTVLLDGLTLGSMNAATKVIAGLAVGAAASTYIDTRKALDGNDSAAVPKFRGTP